MPPVLAFEWAMFGHFYMWHARSCWVPILLESAYTIMLDCFAISRHIWTIYPASGIKIPVHPFGNDGIQLEEILVYSLTSALVVLTLQPFLVITKAYYQWEVKRSWPAFLLSMICSDGMPKEAPRQSDALDMPLREVVVGEPVHEEVNLQMAVQAFTPTQPGFKLSAPSSAPSRFSLEGAVNLEREARQLEARGLKREACEKYQHAAVILNQLHTNSSNPRVQEAIKQRINELVACVQALR
jgi:hypothetical protein